MPTGECVVVAVIGGPHDGERFITPRPGLVDGAQLNYLGVPYTIERRARTGSWRAVLRSQRRRREP
jgi:hypothetical protein